MKYLQARAMPYHLFAFVVACATASQHMTILDAYQKPKNAQSSQGHRNLAYDMALDNVQAKFGNGENNEFTLLFHHDDVSGAGVSLTETFLNPFCNSTSNTGGLTGNAVTVSSNPKEIVSVVSTNLTNLGTAVWIPGSGAAQGTIKFCYRLEAVVATVVVSAVDVIVTLLIDKEDSYSVGTTFDTGVSALVPDTLTTSVEYPLTVFICRNNATEVPSPAAILPNGVLQVCISYTGAVAGIAVGSVYSATIDQTNGFNLVIVTAGSVQHDFTTIDCTSVAGTCRVKTNIVRNFFALDNENLSISGTVLMAIGRRELRGSPRRAIDEDSPSLQQHHFSLPLQIQRNGTEPEALLVTSSGGALGGDSFARRKRLVSIMLRAAMASFAIWGTTSFL